MSSDWYKSPRFPGGGLRFRVEQGRIVGVRFVQALIAAGRLAAQKIGRDWLIEEHALLAVAERKPGRPPR